MKVFIQPENAHEHVVLLAKELLLTTATGEEYRLTKMISLPGSSPESSFSAIPYFTDHPNEQEQPLRQLQQVVEVTLAEHKELVHALYKEVSSSGVSYYILLKNDTPDFQQAILSQLYESPIEELRRHTGPVYYCFFPKEKEPLLAECELIKL